MVEVVKHTDPLIPRHDNCKVIIIFYYVSAHNKETSTYVALKLTSHRLTEKYLNRDGLLKSFTLAFTCKNDFYGQFLWLITCEVSKRSKHSVHPLLDFFLK